MVGSSDEEVTMGPICYQRVIIELAKNPKPPVQTVGSSSSTRQATFDDMEWSITKTEGEKQERLQKDAEKWCKEAEADQAQEAEKKLERIQKNQDAARERQRCHRAQKKALNPKLPKNLKNLNDVSCCNDHQTVTNLLQLASSVR